MILDDETLYDLICILQGHFYPLKTFMGKKDWESVCTSMYTSTNLFFPLPVTLAVSHASVNDVIELCDNTNYIIAKLHIDEVYIPDVLWECENAYGTTDNNHPYVKYKMQHINMRYVSGKLIEMNKPRFYDFEKYRMLPSDIHSQILKNGWKTLVGFQTRNPMHRSHFELTKYALEQTNDPSAVLLLNPVVGPTQPDDIDYSIRVNCYKSILNKYGNQRVVLSLLPLTMRMAGPKEACLHALIRKNNGCTHFIVGRDHAGPSNRTKAGDNFYNPDDAVKMFVKYADVIGIKPIVSKNIVYNSTKQIYQPIERVSSTDVIYHLSGSELRERLQKGETIPEWFTFSEVSDILIKHKSNQGMCVYIIGLSGSGKTTIANKLKAKITEKYITKRVTILDGDIVRTNLSKGLGFSKEDRSTNVRRIGYVASEIVKHGGIVICANIAPYDNDRLANRSLIETYGKYYEVWMDTSLDVCRARDTKGLYKLADEGKLKEFTGVSDPFETPTKSDFVLSHHTSDEDIVQSILNVLL